MPNLTTKYAISGLFQGINNGFNAAMEQKRAEDQRVRTQINSIVNNIRTSMPDSLMLKNQKEMLNKYNTFVDGLTGMSQSKTGFNRGLFSAQDLMDIQYMAGNIMNEFNNIKQSEAQIIADKKKFDAAPAGYYDADYFQSGWDNAINSTNGSYPVGGLLRTTPGDIMSAVNTQRLRYEDRLQDVTRNVGDKTITSTQYNITDEERYNAYSQVLMDERNRKAIVDEFILNNTTEDAVAYLSQYVTDPQQLESLALGIKRVHDQSIFGGRDVFTKDLQDNQTMQAVAAEWGINNFAPKMFQENVTSEKPYKAPSESESSSGKWSVTDKTLLDGTQGTGVISFKTPQNYTVNVGDLLSVENGVNIDKSSDQRGTFKVQDIYGGYAYGYFDKVPTATQKRLTQQEYSNSDYTDDDVAEKIEVGKKKKGLLGSEPVYEYVIKETGEVSNAMVKIPVSKIQNQVLSTNPGIPLSTTRATAPVQAQEFVSQRPPVGADLTQPKIRTYKLNVDGQEIDVTYEELKKAGWTDSDIANLEK